MTNLCRDPLVAGKQVMAVFYNCNLSKTGDWATIENLLTDLATTDAFAVLMTEPTSEPAIGTVQRGLSTIPIDETITKSGVSVNRQANNSDYDFWNSMFAWYQKQQLRMAVVTINNDLTDYSGFYADLSGLAPRITDGLEQWSGDIVLRAEFAGAATGAFVKPARLADHVANTTTAYYELTQIAY